MSDLEGKQVLLCGRVDGIPRDEAENEFGRAAALCMAAGAKHVLNPVSLLDKSASRESAMRSLIGWLVNHADSLVLLPGFEYSVGASRVCMVARECGIDAVRLIELAAPMEASDE